MRVTREVKFGAWIVAAVVIAGLSFFIGGSLRPDEQPYYIFETAAAAYQQPVTIPATSRAGFTGFGEVDGTASRTVIAGRVVEVSQGAVVLEAPGGKRTSLRFGPQASIARLVEASREQIRPGATVAIRLDEDNQDSAAAVLIVSQP
jgi:hypothetical protein